MVSKKPAVWLFAFISLIILVQPFHASVLHARAGTVPTLVGNNNPIAAASTYPRAIILNDGSILATYTSFANGNSIITFSRSTDKGVTWSQVGTAAQGPTASSDIDNPFVIQLPSGRLLVAFRNHDQNPATQVYLVFRITICYSDNNGISWSFLSTAVLENDPSHGVWEPFMRLATDNTLQLYYSRLNGAYDQDSLLRTSTDGGLTWSATSTVISGSNLPNTRDGMLGVATISNTTIIAVFESVLQGSTFVIDSVTSPDDGKTWGNRQRVYTPTGTNNNAGSPQVINVGGTLVVSFITDEDTAQHRWFQGASFKIVTSGDGGRSWGHKITVSGVLSLWPGLLVLDERSFLALADFNGVKAQRVTLS